MSAFAAAAAALAADDNLGEAARYIPAGGGTPIPCRVIRYQLDPVSDLGQQLVRQAGLVFSVLISEVPAPLKGASLEIGGNPRLIFDVQPDEDALTNRVSVR